MKKNLRFIGVAILLVLYSVVLIACGSSGGGSNNDNGDGGNVQSIGRIDITNSKTLALVSQDSGQTSSKESLNSAASSTSRDILYKVTQDGLLIEVNFYDKQGNKIDSSLLTPRKIIDLTKDYLYVEFAPTDPINWFRFFVRKSDGAVFQAPSPRDHGDSLGITQYFYAERTTATISDGNIYYPTNTCWECGSALNRIDVRDSANLFDTRISPSSDSLDRYGDVPLVDKSGNILYFGNSGGIPVVRLIKPDGSMSDISGIFPDGGDISVPDDFPCDSGCTFLGPAGNIYYMNWSYVVNEHGNAEDKTSIYELNIDNKGTPSFKLYGERSGDPVNLYYSASKRKYLSIGGKVLGIYMKSYADKTAAVVEVYNPTGTNLLQPVNNLLLDEIYDAKAGTAYYFLFSRDISAARKLYRVSSDTHEVTELSLTSDYEIYKFEVISDNDVMFHALRYSDGADVIGTINQLNEVHIISAVAGHPSVTLVRVL
ncbi:MAG: hypothetical protein AB1499_06340 [Nitrospirota bacterium]